MADIAALQLTTMSPPASPVSFPTSPDSPQRGQLLWRCSASSVSGQTETFQNRKALSGRDSLTGAIDDSYGVFQSAKSVANTSVPTPKSELYPIVLNKMLI